MKDYPVVFFWSEADQAYIADLPDLQGCTADGSTPEDALREVLVVAEMWLGVAREDGRRLPQPSRPLAAASR